MLFRSIETAKKIRQVDGDVKIIFQTSSAEFAVESYSVNAFYYALKPMPKDNFFRLLDKITLLIDKEKNNYIIVKCKTGVAKIYLKDLTYAEVAGRTIYYHLSNGNVLEQIGAFYDLEGILGQNKGFLKPHRSFLVNIEYISFIDSKEIKLRGQKLADFFQIRNKAELDFLLLEMTNVACPTLVM